MLSVIMQNVVMLSVIMLRVMAPTGGELVRCNFISNKGIWGGDSHLNISGAEFFKGANFEVFLEESRYEI
jgi:hypothetical protein